MQHSQQPLCCQMQPTHGKQYTQSQGQVYTTYDQPELVPNYQPPIVPYPQPPRRKIYITLPQEQGVTGAIIEGIFLLMMDQLPHYLILVYLIASLYKIFVQARSCTRSASKTSSYLLSHRQSYDSQMDLSTNQINLDYLEFYMDLVVLHIHVFYVILSIDFLTIFRVPIDYFAKAVIFQFPNKRFVTIIIAIGNYFIRSFINHIDVAKLERVLVDIHIVVEYPYVFLEIPGLPPASEIVFCIDLLPGIAPLHQSPYLVSFSKKEDSKKQLDNIFVWGFIQISQSPWGTYVIFVTKNDGSH